MFKDAPIGSPVFHIYNVLYLTVFTGLMTFGMLFVYYLTYEPPNPLKDVELMLGNNVSSYDIVQKNLTKQDLSSLEDRVLLESYFNTSEILRFFIKDKNTGNPVMTVFSVSSGGFGGPVKALIGTDGNTVLAIRVLDVASETAGLGQRIAETGFQRQFLNKKLNELPMDRAEWGNDIDMISGATYSSSAVVNNIIKAFNLYKVGDN